MHFTSCCKVHFFGIFNIWYDHLFCVLDIVFGVADALEGGCGDSSCPFPVAVSPACFFAHCFGWLIFLNRRLDTQGKSPMDGRFRKWGYGCPSLPTRAVPIHGFFCLEISHPKHRTKKQAGLTATGNGQELSPQPPPNAAPKSICPPRFRCVRSSTHKQNHLIH